MAGEEEEAKDKKKKSKKGEDGKTKLGMHTHPTVDARKTRKAANPTVELGTTVHKKCTLPILSS